MRGFCQVVTLQPHRSVVVVTTPVTADLLPSKTNKAVCFSKKGKRSVNQKPNTGYKFSMALTMFYFNLYKNRS